MLKKKEKTYKILYSILLTLIPVRFSESYFREKLHFVPGISVRFNELSALCVSAL